MRDDTSNLAHLFGDRRKRERDEREAIAAFVDSARRGDMPAVLDLLEQVETAYEGWRRVFQRLVRLDRAPKPAAQMVCIQHYMKYEELQGRATAPPNMFAIFRIAVQGGAPMGH